MPCTMYNMARPSFLQNILPDIKGKLALLNEKTFALPAAEKLFYNNSSEWGLPDSMTKAKFINGLAKLKIWDEIDLLSADNKVKKLYSLPGASNYDIIHSINRNGYFTHYTALYYHDLTLQIPKVFYLNAEHSVPTSAPKDSLLNQAAIDRAFAKDQRKSLNEYTWNNFRVILLRGKWTNELGVQQIINEHGTFKITDIERTLIDAVVRPVYCGGVTEVLAAFKAAEESLDIEKLFHHLKKLDYLYPYHQCIGFYLEKAGYTEDSMKKFGTLDMKFNFYMTYNIRQKEYNERWKIYYPKGL